MSYSLDKTTRIINRMKVTSILRKYLKSLVFRDNNTDTLSKSESMKLLRRKFIDYASCRQTNKRNGRVRGASSNSI